MIVFKINIRIVEDLEILKTMDISDFDKEYNQIEGFFQICMGSHKEGCYYHEDELKDGEIGSELLNYWLNRLLDVVNCFSNGEEYVAFHELETMNRWLEFKASEGEIQIRTAIDSSMKIKDLLITTPYCDFDYIESWKYQIEFSKLRNEIVKSVNIFLHQLEVLNPDLLKTKMALELIHKV